MFEDSIFESAGVIHTRSRNWMFATFALNASILLLMVLLPLIFPEALPHRLCDMLLTAPPPTTPPPQLVRIVSEPFRGAPQMDTGQLNAPRRIPTTIYKPSAPEPPGNGRLLVMNNGPATGIPGGLPGAGTAPAVVAAPRPHGPIVISKGVAQGLIVHQVMPQYPAIARAMHIGGTVLLQAVITRTGAIDKVRVLSGPAVLQQASIDAVRQWRFRPYLLNGEPVDVETTVSVVFTIDR